jgi:CheY-like chemotaxis protein
VLCIDDNKDVLATVVDVLQNSGYSTLTAASGSEGLRLLRSV